MTKTFKKGQTVKIISTFISLPSPEYVTAEIMFCNNQSLLISFNKELYEIPEKAILGIVDAPVKHDSLSVKKQEPKKAAVKTKKQRSKKNKNTPKTLVMIANKSPKTKKAKYSSIKATLIYIPAKKESYSCSYYRKNETSLGTAHDRAYWYMTHPYTGGGCCPR